jgi:apolipoprotein N-acyltransferase
MNFVSTKWLLQTNYGDKAILVFFANSFLMTLPVILWHLLFNKLNFKLSSFIPIWLSFEYIHLHWSLSWPWLTIGNIFSSTTDLVQWYEYTGVLGGSLWSLLFGLFLFRLSNGINQKLLIQTFALFIIPIVISALLLIPSHSGKKIKVSVLQPNFQLRYLSNIEKIKFINSRLLQEALGNVDYILLPEYTFSDPISFSELRQSAEIEIIAKFLRRNFPLSKMILGLEVIDIPDYPERLKKYNALVQIDSSGINNLYYKNKYIPFQETVPAGFGFLGYESANYSYARNSITDFMNKKINFLPVLSICYESIYGEYLGAQVSGELSAIFMFSNEAFLNQTVGKDQYFNFIKLRAIELRKSIARTSNGGYAAIIDQTGSELRKSQSTEFAILTSEISINKTITFYALHGDYIGVISLIYCVLLFSYRLFLYFKKK